jgi:hypothetical protein
MAAEASVVAVIAVEPVIVVAMAIEAGVITVIAAGFCLFVAMMAVEAGVDAVMATGFDLFVITMAPLWSLRHFLGITSFLTFFLFLVCDVLLTTC